jgi:hypothetical protein
MNQTAQDHFDTIINALLPFALEMIGKSGTFLPFGGYINQAGTFEMLGVEHGEKTEPKDLVGMFRKVLEDGVRKDGYKAFGICAHMHAEIPGQTGKKDLIVTSMEHESGVAVDSYLPYERNADGEVVHGQLTSELVEPTVFQERADGFVQ